MARFNGETGVNIPESLIASDAFPSHKFTIASWMRHRHNKAQDKHTKEHILCKADDHRKLTNRLKHYKTSKVNPKTVLYMIFLSKRSLNVA